MMGRLNEMRSYNREIVVIVAMRSFRSVSEVNCQDEKVIACIHDLEHIPDEAVR